VTVPALVVAPGVVTAPEAGAAPWFAAAPAPGSVAAPRVAAVVVTTTVFGCAVPFLDGAGNVSSDRFSLAQAITFPAKMIGCPRRLLRVFLYYDLLEYSHLQHR